MKKLAAATLLSISLCVYQTGSDWASNQVDFPLPVTDEGGMLTRRFTLLVEIIIADILKALEFAMGYMG